jgi:hypothetical protein
MNNIRFDLMIIFEHCLLNKDWVLSLRSGTQST